MTSGSQPLAGTVEFDQGLAVVTLVGDIDIATAPQFLAFMDVAVGANPQRVIVDMTGVIFLGASGLTVLLVTAARLRITGANLAVRGVSPWIFVLFEITGLTESLGVQRPAYSSELVRVLAEAGSASSARLMLDAALKLVVTMAHSVVAGADGVSITLPRHGRFATVAASNDVVLEMDHDQYDTGQGPCLDAATHGHQFYIDSLHEESRWPAFVPRAQARGIESILSTPLLTGEYPIGALNIYSRTSGVFAEHERQWADQFAAQAATVVTTAEGDASETVMGDRIRQALQSREIIAIATGIVMHRDQVPAAEAETHLRQISRTTSQTLANVAARIVNLNGEVPTPPIPTRGDRS